MLHARHERPPLLCCFCHQCKLLLALLLCWNMLHVFVIHPSNLLMWCFAGRCRGYRALTRLIKSKYHLQVTEESVRLILTQVDPVGVSFRRHHRLQRRTYCSRGPNFCWHLDGYDKLVPYGFAISGCVASIYMSNVHH